MKPDATTNAYEYVGLRRIGWSDEMIKNKLNRAWREDFKEYYEANTQLHPEIPQFN